MPNLALSPEETGQGTDEGLASFAEIIQNPLITPKPKRFMITGNIDMVDLKQKAPAVGVPAAHVFDKQTQEFKMPTAQATLREAFDL